jgi:hypothetical protein
MIKAIDRPEQFSHLPASLECLAFCDESGPYMLVGLQLVGKDCACHAENLRWSHTLAKQVKADWASLIDNYIRPSGATRAIASFEDVKDKVWPKFIRLLGFPEPTRVMISVMEV